MLICCNRPARYISYWAESSAACLFSHKTRRRSSYFATFLTATAHNTLMDGSFNAVIHFQIELWELVLCVGGGFLDITQGTGIDNVAHNETLNRLVLGNGLASRDTADAVDVTAAVLVSSVIASLDSHVEWIYIYLCVCWVVYGDKEQSEKRARVSDSAAGLRENQSVESRVSNESIAGL